MNLIDEFTQRLTYSETDICHCNYCTETRGILKELLDEAEKRHKVHIQEALNTTSFYDRDMIEAVSTEAFKEMRDEKPIDAASNP